MVYVTAAHEKLFGARNGKGEKNICEWNAKVRGDVVTPWDNYSLGVPVSRSRLSTFDIRTIFVADPTAWHSAAAFTWPHSASVQPVFGHERALRHFSPSAYSTYERCAELEPSAVMRYVNCCSSGTLVLIGTSNRGTFFGHFCRPNVTAAPTGGMNTTKHFN